MRQTWLALVVAAVGGFAMANCGSNSNNMSDMGKDMAGPPAPSDMAVVKLNCLGVGFCIASCTSDPQTCFTMCGKMAKAGSANKFAMAFNCGQTYCAPNPDAGMTAACVTKTDPADGGTRPALLCDPNQSYDDCFAGKPSGCNSCLDNAVGAPLLGDGTTPPTGMCTDASAPSCKGGTMCTTVMNACINDV
jgi:hypothetical protein